MSTLFLSPIWAHLRRKSWGMDARDAGEVLADIREHGAKYVALLIAALAALLAVVEMTGGNAEQDALKANVDASNLWAFYQAKTIRQTT
jgi:hypothetical protein